LIWLSRRGENRGKSFCDGGAGACEGVEPFVDDAHLVGDAQDLFDGGLEEIKDRVAKVYGLSPEALSRKGRKGPVTHAKAALIYLGTQFKGQTCHSMGQLTGIKVQSASAAKFRGEVFVRDNLDLQKLIN
jgi:hypothetical protein